MLPLDPEERLIRGNIVKTVLITTFFGLSTFCISGSLMQTFLGEIGLTKYIYLHSTLLQGVNLSSIFLFSHFADRTPNLIRRTAMTVLPIALLFFLYIPLCIMKEATFRSFLLATGVGLVQSFFYGLRTVCEYKLPYRIIPVKRYGSMSAASGFIYGLASLGMGACISYLSTVISYRKLMLFAFPASFVFAFVAFLITLSLKPLPEAGGNRQTNAKASEKITFMQLFPMPVFHRLLIPNLFRGIAAGVVGVLAGIALERGLGSSVTTAMVSISSAATLVSCFLFGLLTKKIPPRLLVMLGSLLMMLLPLIGFTGKWGFLILYTVISSGRVFVDYSVPAALYRVVPDRIAGPYHAWRMVLNTGGSMLGSLLAGLVPTVPLLVGAALLQLVCGIGYLHLPKIAAENEDI